MAGWDDEIARARAERDDFKARSTAKRKELAAMRKAGRTRTLEFLEAMSRMHEYAASARQRQAFIDEHMRTPDGDAHWYLAGKRDGSISIAAAIRSLPIGEKP